MSPSHWLRRQPRLLPLHVAHIPVRRLVLGLFAVQACVWAMRALLGGTDGDEVYNDPPIVNRLHANQKYNRQVPLIFIGGVPRSGTTLMRAMLDAHPDIRCGQETHVIPSLLISRDNWLKSNKSSMRLDEAGITKPVLDAAIAAFIFEVIVRHGEPAPRLCNKDPLTLTSGTYIQELFPNAKFIFMIRDGRATVYSMITRRVTVTGFQLDNFRQCMKEWNSVIESMDNQCKELGHSRCLRVRYEQLVLHPRTWMEKVLRFLDVRWDDSVLHHEDFINKRVKLSKLERSSAQVIQPVNMEALDKWVGHIPEDVYRDMEDLAPMLSVLGYDPFANPPKYGDADDDVVHNTYKVGRNRSVWKKKANEMFNVEGDTNYNTYYGRFLGIV